MRFAHFSSMFGKKGNTPRERHERLWRERTLGDDFGFTVAHHCGPGKSAMSSSKLHAAARARRPIRLLGTDVISGLHVSEPF